MLQDLRYAVRVLLQTKLWTGMVVLSLALGIGANTALFSAVNGLLLRKVNGVRDPDSLVRLRGVGRNEMSNSSSDYGMVVRDGGLPTRATFSNAVFQQLKKDNKTMTDLLAGAPMGSINLVVDGKAEIVSGYLATGNYHALLGVRTTAGRLLRPDDDQPGASPVAVLSYGFWDRRFGRDPKVIGRVVQANNTPITIIGVAAPEFTGIQRVLESAPDLTLPLALDPQLNPESFVPPGASRPLPPRLEQPTYWWLQVVGRLKPGITMAQVEGNLDGVFRQTAREGLDAYLAAATEQDRGAERNQNRTQIPHLRVQSAAQGVYDNQPDEMRGMTILSVVVGLILLIVCANVANLLLARATARQKEISVRLSLGATRTRLVRQLLTESVLLGVLGASGGVLVAYWGKQLLPGQASQAPIDWRVLSFATGLALLTGVLFGIAPALRATGEHAGAALKQTSRGIAGSRGLLSKSLLVVQVAISLVLLIGAGLFLRTVDNLRQVNVGFNPKNLVLFAVNPQLNRYESARIGQLYTQLTERLKATPGIKGVTLSNPALLSGGVNSTGFVIQGRPFRRGQQGINRLRVADNFFETMEMPILVGRGFTPRDDSSGPKVAVINETAVKKFFTGRPVPIGERFGGSPENNAEIEIVGVVRDAKYNSVRDDVPATMYVPYTQNTIGGMTFEVRTAGDPTKAIASIREAVRQVDPNVPLMRVSTQMEQIDQRISQERVFAQAYALFGGLALVVASIGLFGLMSYNVTRRTNEIGIRMALGAERHNVVRMILGESMVLVVIGLVIGLCTALASGKLAESLLFGLQPTDVSTLAAAMLVMTAVSAFAGYLPARRASRVDPMVALHYE
jgi:predicted permease